jgi:hypothetical protein
MVSSTVKCNLGKGEKKQKRNAALSFPTKGMVLQQKLRLTSLRWISFASCHFFLLATVVAFAMLSLISEHKLQIANR